MKTQNIIMKIPFIYSSYKCVQKINLRAVYDTAIVSQTTICMRGRNTGKTWLYRQHVILFKNIKLCNDMHGFNVNGSIQQISKLQ